MEINAIKDIEVSQFKNFLDKFSGIQDFTLIISSDLPEDLGKKFSETILAVNCKRFNVKVETR
jgi:hypothetical protein